MEYIMARDAYAPDLAACGAINGKLRIMSAALRECLGGEDWDAPRWERFFDE